MVSSSLTIPSCWLHFVSILGLNTALRVGLGLPGGEQGYDILPPVLYIY